ncbi:hypothetical protein QZH41_019567 [Actinostola sp. cb2023]|nr:hypothetical protein QZH41_019567 [Actinostola sp. cb2023]
MHIIASILGLDVTTIELIIPAYHCLTEVEFAKQCIEEYKKVLAYYNTEDGTCTRWNLHEIFINCLSKRSDIRGQMVDSMRYFFTQQAMFVSKLNFCPYIEFKDIQSITDQTEFAQKHKYLDTIKFDAADKCAIDVHKKCVKHYVELFSKEMKICDDVTSWINCYASESVNIGCDSEIVKHFSKMLKTVGNFVIREIRRHAGVECQKMEL